MRCALCLCREWVSDCGEGRARHSVRAAVRPDPSAARTEGRALPAMTDRLLCRSSLHSPSCSVSCMLVISAMKPLLHSLTAAMILASSLTTLGAEHKQPRTGTWYKGIVHA